MVIREDPALHAHLIWRAIADRLNATESGGVDISDADLAKLCAQEFIALSRLANITPTTPAGALAQLEAIRRMIRDDLGGWRDGIDKLAMDRLEEGLRSMSGAR